MEPLISIRINDRKGAFQPGEQLECEYQIDAVSADEVQAVEASVLWHTEGKGDEDLFVHYFERHTASDVEGSDLRRLRCFETQLPNSPLTYPGVTIKVRWCVRVRAFLPRGRESFFEHTFTLGNIPPARRIEPADDTEDS